MISFTIDGIHPHDLGTILDTEGVAVRTGHHCAMPVMDFFDVPATARASFGCYSRDDRISTHWFPHWARRAQGIRLMDLKELYRDVILDHNKSPRLFGRLDPADSSADGHNPLCGDRLHITVRLEDDRVTDLRFDGKGCAISVASASLMCEAVKGKQRSEIAHLFRRCHASAHAPQIRFPMTWASSPLYRVCANSRCA